MNARRTALSALIATRRQDAWSDGILKQYIARDGLDRRDAAFCSSLCYGVLQNRMLLDFYLSHFLRCKLRELQPVVLVILRLGAYQLAFLDRVPASAAVNEAVEQCKTYANRSAAGLVNGVLRAMARAEKLPEPTDLATRYSHPDALVALLRESVGDALLEPLLQSDNAPAPTTLQLNPLFDGQDETLRELREADVSLTPHPWLTDCYLAKGTGDLARLPAFSSGRIFVQDAAARLAAMAAGLDAGMHVLDACAAPGGKSFAAAMQMQNRGSILSCDIHAHKLQLIERGAERLGIGCITTRLQSASVRDDALVGAFDAVIADVPCSGLGVIRKKPDIRYKELAQTEKLPALQGAILDNVCDYVRVGGVLLYSTCTILRRENQDVAHAFLARHPNFRLEPFAVPAGAELENDGMLTLLPCVHDTDGFFICKMRRIS